MFRKLFAAAVLLASVFCACNKDIGSRGMSGGLYGGGSIARFDSITENPYLRTADSATSTFSVDADGASYSAMRAWTEARGGVDAIRQALRTEELVNYFPFNYSENGQEPITVNGEVSGCPWNTAHKLIRIGIKGRSLAPADYPPANFVLLIDVSGSMGTDGKLALLKKGFVAFANQMRPTDRIAIVTYAGNAGVALLSTPGTNKSLIISVLNSLGPGGSTNGAGGITKAYEIAQQNFIAGGNNRVILGTDGDFNVGVSSTEALVDLIKQKRESGVFLTVLGVGMDNLNDGMMEKLANNGNGNYEYIDREEEMKKVFIEEYSKFLTVAKDVKVQVTFNPALVEEYRLIGYENRALQTGDFTDDSKDAGEIGAGQTITALYEIKPKTNAGAMQQPNFSIDFRYKKPAESTSRLITLDVFDTGNSFTQASENMRFAGSVAALGLYLRNSPYKGNVSLSDIRSWASSAVSFDPYGYRARHLQLLNQIR